MMKKHVLDLKWAVVFSAILVLFAGLKDVSAVDTNRMVLVLDASGSMWGQIEGKAKIQIAKEVMAELVEQIPAEFHTGLMVYGHRRKGDCKDIERQKAAGQDHHGDQGRECKGEPSCHRTSKHRV
jgi:Ca-activated chloride channel family protein